jgi:hypothetical protein
MIRKFQIAALVGALALTLAGIAQAHGHRDRDDSGQYAYHQGYRDGFDHGRMDRSRGAGYNYRNDDYEDADRGYNPDWGNRDEYREAYRSGYVAGYNDAFYGRAGRFDSDDFDRDHDRSYRYGSVAAQIGYQDGFTEGRKDVADRKKFKPEKHDNYEDGDHGYRHEYGDKNAYKQQYRQAFMEGYENGYHGGPGAAYDRP